MSFCIFNQQRHRAKGTFHEYCHIANASTLAAMGGTLYDIKLSIITMRIYVASLLLLFSLVSCKSTPEKVKANKEKFIQVAKENSKPIDLNNLSDLYEQTKSNNVERKMKYLGVNNIQTVYGLDKSNGINLDSVVLFTKSNYIIIYDFATIERTSETIKRNCGLTDFEMVDERLYMGQK